MAPSESEAKASSPTATDADLARVLTRKDEPEDRSEEIRQLREENARLRKWDELTREIDRDERNEADSKHYAQALVQHARQQRAAREAGDARLPIGGWIERLGHGRHVGIRVLLVVAQDGGRGGLRPEA